MNHNDPWSLHKIDVFPNSQLFICICILLCLHILVFCYLHCIPDIFTLFILYSTLWSGLFQTCASRWFNKYFEGDGYFFMNGLCYEIPLDFNSKNIITIPALVDGRKQTMTIPGQNITKLNYGMGNLGGSVHYSVQVGSLALYNCVFLLIRGICTQIYTIKWHTLCLPLFVQIQNPYFLKTECG